MAKNMMKWRSGTVLRYGFGGALCVFVVAAMRAGLPWYWSLLAFSAIVTIVLGRRRIFKTGVTRTADEIVCRYVPWFEGNAYVLIVLLPMVGIALIAAGCVPVNPSWLRYGGIVLLLLTPVGMYSVVRMWRRCVLRFSPLALGVRLAAPGFTLTEISRERVRSITPKTVSNGVSGSSLQVEICYRHSDSSDDVVNTVLLGLQLTVQPNNLLNALVAWNDGAADNPTELLDRVEGILRGHSAAHG